MTHHHHHHTQPSLPSSRDHYHREAPTTPHNHRHNHHHNHQPPPSSRNHNLTPPSSFTDLNLTPPPSHNNHRRNQQYYRPHSNSSSASIRGCCCCLILLFSFLALLGVTVVLVIVLAVKPKKPEFNLQQVGVQYINLAGVTTAANAPTTASLSLAIRMLFTAKNDNKVGIKYGVSTFNIMYRGIPLGRGTVPGFYQPAHSVRRVQTTVTVDRVNLLQPDAADLVRDAITNDRVELRIMGDVNAKIRIIGLTSPAVQASVDCAIAISPTKQALTYKQCGFEGLQV